MGLKTALTALVVIGAIGVHPIIHFTTQETLSAVVLTNKERINDKDSSKYLIWSETETFENTDSFLAWKFNSSDVYGKLRVGATCDLDVVGFRVPFLSWYRNILAARCA